MQKLLIGSILAALVLVGIAPASTASTVIPTTPASGGCVLIDSDACSTTYATGATSVYVIDALGEFTGTVTMTITSATDPTQSFTQTCTGQLVGLVMASGGCTTSGVFPFGAINVACSSDGSGVAACTIEGN